MFNFTFNESEYLAANPDVANAVKLGVFLSGREHYDKFGKKEGRKLKRFHGPNSREDKVFHLLNKKGLGLEIGPSHNPVAPKKNGFNVHILDHASADELKSKYEGHGINLDNIEEVDFIWHGEPINELIGKNNYYDWIIASHVIEHVPDLISFLQQCEALLKQDGFISLVIPDKRYCFDFFSACSSTGNLLDAFSEKRVRPSHGQVFDYIANSSSRNGNIAWSRNDKGGADKLVHSFAEAQDHWIRSRTTLNYIDVHCWRFTPASFRLLIFDLNNLGLINLKIKGEFETCGCEFYITLSKENDDFIQFDRFSILQTKKIEES